MLPMMGTPAANHSPPAKARERGILPALRTAGVWPALGTAGVWPALGTAGILPALGTAGILPAERHKWPRLQIYMFVGNDSSLR